MKVILLQDVAKIGRAGEEHDVNEGHARNYLIPRGLAQAATPGMERVVQEKAAAKKRQQEQAKQARRDLAAKLKSATITLTRRSADGTKLFGSVAAKDIAAALAAQGFAVEARALALKEPIRTTGAHRVTAALGDGLDAEFTVTVTAEA